jgi:hypothetical protein
MSTNVSGLCEEAELEAQMFVLAQMFIRIPNVQFSTEPAFSQNPCYKLPFYVLVWFPFRLANKLGITKLKIVPKIAIRTPSIQAF